MFTKLKLAIILGLTALLLLGIVGINFLCNSGSTSSNNIVLAVESTTNQYPIASEGEIWPNGWIVRDETTLALMAPNSPQTINEVIVATLSEARTAASQPNTYIKLGADIDGQGQTVFTISANNIVIDGQNHTISNALFAVYSDNNAQSNIEVKNLKIIEPLQTGIHLRRDKHVNVHNNEVTRTGNTCNYYLCAGIHFESSWGNEMQHFAVHDNIVNGGVHGGIVFQDGMRYGKVYNNTITNAGFGGQFYANAGLNFDSEPIIIDIYNNTITGGKDCLGIRGQTSDLGWGLNVYNNTLSSCAEHGLRVQDGTYSSIFINNTISNVPVGIDVESANDGIHDLIFDRNTLNNVNLPIDVSDGEILVKDVQFRNTVMSIPKTPFARIANDAQNIHIVDQNITASEITVLDNALVYISSSYRVGVLSNGSPAEGAIINIKDKLGAEILSGITQSNGQVLLSPVPAVSITIGGQSAEGPYYIITSFNGQEADAEIMPDDRAYGIDFEFTDTSILNAGLKIMDFEYQSPEGKQETITTAIWYPTKNEPQTFIYSGAQTAESKVALDGTIYLDEKPYPLILFAHGAYGSGYNSAFFMEYLAKNGYIVIAPDYTDTKPPEYTEQIAFSRIKEGNVGAPAEIFEIAKQFVEDISEDREFFLSYLSEHRFPQTSFLIDEMLRLNKDRGSFFYQTIKEDAIGVNGHSEGGTTILGKAGAHPNIGFKDNRIKAVLIFSAPAYPFETTYSNINIPFMLMTGEDDEPTVHPELPRKIIYDETNLPKYYLVLDYGTHFSFANGVCKGIPLYEAVETDPQARAISQYGLAFFDKYLKRNTSADEVLGKTDPAWLEYIKEIELLKPNLTLTKSALVNGQPASEAASGNIITYTIVYQNIGAGEATNVIITDPIPAGTIYETDSARFVSGSGIINDKGPVISWTITTLPAGQGGEAEFRVRVAE